MLNSCKCAESVYLLATLIIKRHLLLRKNTNRYLMSIMEAVLKQFCLYLRLRFDLFSSIYFYDAILVDVLEDVWSVHEDADRACSRHDEEDVQLQPVDHHRYVLPIFTCL